MRCHPSLPGAGILLAVVVAGCGSSGGDQGANDDPATPSAPAAPAAPDATGQQDPAVEPCDLTDPAAVEAAFGGSIGAESPGPARNCSYPFGTGTVEVYYYGAADDWEGIKQGYADNRGPLTDASGVGDQAFHPGDVEGYEIVVQAGDTVFAVGVVGGDGTPAGVRALAESIAADLG